MDLNLKGRVALVTGAGAGIGLATVDAFLREGVKIIAADIDVSALTKRANPDQLLAVEADLADAAQTESIVAKGLAAFGKIDILFNNAGIIQPRGSFLNVSDEDWLKTFSINVMGYVHAARAVLPSMLAAGKGVLIHNASESARIGSPFVPDYCVSKAAVLMLSKVLSIEFTPRGIRSNVVSPAQVRTPMIEKPGGVIDIIAGHFGVGREQAVELWLKEAKSLTGRIGEPEEVANVVLYLASDVASFITGVEVPVDGGVRHFV